MYEHYLRHESIKIMSLFCVLYFWAVHSFFFLKICARSVDLVYVISWCHAPWGLGIAAWHINKKHNLLTTENSEAGKVQSMWRVKMRGGSARRKSRAWEDSGRKELDTLLFLATMWTRQWWWRLATSKPAKSRWPKTKQHYRQGLRSDLSK